MAQGKKTELTPEILTKVGELAFNGCQNNTIEGIMQWADAFITNCKAKISVNGVNYKSLSRYLTQKRQERKSWLLAQNRRIIESNQLGAAASTLIFTEKQSEHMGGLGFTDRPDANTLQQRPLVLIIGGDQEQIKQVESAVIDQKPQIKTDNGIQGQKQAKRGST